MAVVIKLVCFIFCAKATLRLFFMAKEYFALFNFAGICSGNICKMNVGGWSWDAQKRTLSP